MKGVGPNFGVCGGVGVEWGFCRGGVQSKESKAEILYIGDQLRWYLDINKILR